MAEGLSTFLTNIGTFVTQALAWVTDVLAVITASPELTVICLAMPITGFAVGLLSRLFRTN